MKSHWHHQNAYNVCVKSDNYSLDAEQSAQTSLPGTDRTVCSTVVFANVDTRSWHHIKPWVNFHILLNSTSILSILSVRHQNGNKSQCVSPHRCLSSNVCSVHCAQTVTTAQAWVHKSGWIICVMTSNINNKPKQKHNKCIIFSHHIDCTLQIQLLFNTCMNKRSKTLNIPLICYSPATEGLTKSVSRLQQPTHHVPITLSLYTVFQKKVHP